MTYMLIVESNQVLDRQGNIFTPKGQQFVVVESEWGPTTFQWNGKSIPSNFVRFETIWAAEQFAADFKGHPWWCECNGFYKILEVKPVYKNVVIGYEL